MGERKLKLKEVVVAVKRATDELADYSAPMSVATADGTFQVKWDTKSNATAMRQLAFVAEFFDAAGVFERWVKQCPLLYTSPNAPRRARAHAFWLKLISTFSLLKMSMFISSSHILVISFSLAPLPQRCSQKSRSACGSD